jgi:hypothetical protein
MTDKLKILDNRLCGRVTKTGKRYRAHAALGDHGKHIGCYLHDPRRETHREGDRERFRVSLDSAEPFSEIRALRRHLERER